MHPSVCLMCVCVIVIGDKVIKCKRKGKKQLSIVRLRNLKNQSGNKNENING